MSFAYTTKHAVTLATRSLAYNYMADMLMHFDALGINLSSIVVNADHTITVTIDKLIRSDHSGFWDLGDPVGP